MKEDTFSSLLKPKNEKIFRIPRDAHGILQEKKQLASYILSGFLHNTQITWDTPRPISWLGVIHNPQSCTVGVFFAGELVI